MVSGIKDCFAETTTKHTLLPFSLREDFKGFGFIQNMRSDQSVILYVNINMTLLFSFLNTFAQTEAHLDAFEALNQCPLNISASDSNNFETKAGLEDEKVTKALSRSGGIKQMHLSCIQAFPFRWTV